jgi:hypothetical protein
MAPVLSWQERVQAIREGTKSVHRVLSMNLGSWCPKPLYIVGNTRRISTIHKPHSMLLLMVYSPVVEVLCYCHTANKVIDIIFIGKFLAWV